jgi:hypothetical protein
MVRAQAAVRARAEGRRPDEACRTNFSRDVMVIIRCSFRRAHVLGTNTDPDQPGRNAAQNRKDTKKLEEQWRLRPSLAFQNAADDPPLDGEL